MNRFWMILIWLLCLGASAIAAVWMLLAIIAGSKRAWTLAGSHDQLANAAFGGDEDEKISSRAARGVKDGKRWACFLCRLLDKIDPNHCENSLKAD